MRISRKTLHDALKELNKVADHKSSIPVLSHMYLNAAFNSLTITATDLNRRLSVSVRAEGHIESCCLPAKLLEKLVKPEGRKKNDYVTMKYEDGVVTIEAGGVTTKIKTLDADDFPQPMASAHDLRFVAIFQRAHFRESLSHVIPAMNTDETRMNTCAVSMDEDRLAATDRHRLHWAGLPITVKEPLLVPAASAKTLLCMLKGTVNGLVITSRTDNVLQVRSGSYTLQTKLLQEEFPPYRRAIPPENSETLQVSLKAKLLSQALKQINRISSEDIVNMRVNGQIQLQSADKDATAEVIVPTASSSHVDGEDDLTLNVNLKYLQDAIHKDSDYVTLMFHADEGPVVVSQNKGRAVALVMPCRV